MVCPKCGNRNNKSNICSKCGYRIDTPITVKNYNDEEVIVDAPIITESHTFINEHDFQESLKKHLEKENAENNKKKKNKNLLYIILLLVIIAIIIGAIIILPKLEKNNSSNIEKKVDRNEFISNSWESGEFKINDKKYKLKEKYSKFIENSWTVDLAKYGYDNGYILNDGDKTSTTIQMTNPKYSKSIVQVGFINESKEQLDIKDCSIWSITINNNDVENQIPFELPGGIKTGSSKEDIFKVYGELDESKIYRSEEAKYTTLHYQSSYDNYLDLYIYDDKGLMEINLKKY